MTFFRSRWIAAAILVSCALAAAGALSAARGRQESPAAKPPEQPPPPGKALYEERCSACHGLDAGGAMGPNIQGIPFRLGADAVKGIVRNGLGQGGMPAFAGQLDDAQISQIVDYLLALTHKDTAPVTGDAAHGKQVYESGGCSSCHIIDGQGGDSGPDLSNVGSLRGASYLRNAILYPGTDLPQAHVFLETGGRLDYLYIHLVTKDGHPYDGTRVVEDSFHIVIRDANGKFLSFRKADLRELQKEPGKSVMPSFKGKLSDADVNDLVAYLAGLKGAP
jgi:cytochrome c oxidase cbb3-type subunit III